MGENSRSNSEAMRNILFSTMALSLPIEEDRIEIPYGEGKRMIFDGIREVLEIPESRIPSMAEDLKRAYEHQGKTPHSRGPLKLISYTF